MKQRNNPSITKMFAGKKVDNKIKSMPQLPKLNLTRSLFKQFEKAEILTQLQHNIVKEQLENCPENVNPEYIARLSALLEKFVCNNTKEAKK